MTSLFIISAVAVMHETEKLLSKTESIKDGRETVFVLHFISCLDVVFGSVVL